MKYFKLIILLIFSNVLFAQNSPLSEGTWYKLEVSESGLYKIDFEMLKSMGFDTKHPNTIKVYGYGGILKQSLSDFRYGDLVENQITFVGEEDGTINSSDYILFYGEGPDEITASSSGYLEHEKNFYTRKTYYFVTSSEGAGKRVGNSVSAASSSPVFSALPYLFFHESDEENIIKSGREWFGDPFKYKPVQNFNYSLDDILLDSVCYYNFRYVGGSSSHSTSFRTSLNGTLVNSTSVKNFDLSYGDKAKSTDHTGTFKSSSSLVSVKSEYNNQGDGSASAYVDYFRFVYFRTLRGDKTVLYTIPTGFYGARLQLKNVTLQTQVWDVTKVNDIKRLTIASNQIQLENSTKKLLILNTNDFKIPLNKGQVANQNLHQLQVPELLIVTHKNFLASANEMAKFKIEEQGIETQVATTEQIFNEYSSGRQDISAIRDFMKSLYDRDQKLHFLLLFGDCSYDMFDRVSNNTNYVPIYQSRSSLNNTTSFSSDDYFGFLEDDEGEWIESSKGKEDMEIGIGRLPIKSNEEGYRVISKIKSYVFGSETGGNWKNKVVFVADDGDFQMHTGHADELSEELLQWAPEVNLNKIYLDSYEQISSSSGQIAPSVNQELILKIDQGALIVNYNGHGSEEQWAQENIFNLSAINSLKNTRKLPFFITATCEFGRYDDPLMESGAERLLLNQNGGAIGLMTTTRPVYANSNKTINSSFYRNVFLRNTDSTYDYIGEIHRKTKNQSILSFNNRNFALIGDPTIKLVYPDFHVILDSINGGDLTNLDTIRALQKVEIKGHIENINRIRDVSYNGKLTLTVYDKTNKVTTLGDLGAKPFEFFERRSVVFEGEVEVVNGSFYVSFVVPKDISYSYGIGKLSFYATNTEGKDANGAFSDFVIGGGIDGFNDNLAPEVYLFADDTTFVSGGITSRNPVFIASIFDENGINSTNTGIGHEMTLILDDDVSSVYVLNDYHKSIDNTYKKGWVEYPLRDLSMGMHKLTFKVWDVNNNSTSKDLYIMVSDKGQIQAYPNPFYDEVNFYVDQPRKNIGGEVEMKIYDLYGLEIWTQIVAFESFNSVIDSISWNGQSINGEKINPGVYILVSEIRYEDSLGNITEKTKLILQK